MSTVLALLVLKGPRDNSPKKRSPDRFPVQKKNKNKNKDRHQHKKAMGGKGEAQGLWVLILYEVTPLSNFRELCV